MWDALSDERMSLIYSDNCFWALLEQSPSGLIPAELVTISYCPIAIPPIWRTRSPYLYPRRNRVARLHTRALGSLLVASYGS
jgi:hypothetical protein